MSAQQPRTSQAGGIVFRIANDEPEILLVRARTDPTRWTFPRGHIEAGETPASAALRETRQESGVKGVVLGPVGPPLEFHSGDEPVRVQYYLIAATTPGEPSAGREQRWEAPWQALTALASEDARFLLLQGLRQIEQLKRPPAADPGFEAFLLAEFAHVGEALLQNEELGEKRAAFFVTLASAVVAGVPVWLGKEALRADQRHPLVIVALLVLIVLAHVTLARIVARDAATDRFKRGLKRIRRYFVPWAEDPRLGFLEFNPHQHDERTRWSQRSVGKGGWVITLAIVEAMLLGGLVAAVAATGWPWANVTVGVLSFFLSWCGMVWLANWRYDKILRKATAPADKRQAMEHEAQCEARESEAQREAKE